MELKKVLGYEGLDLLQNLLDLNPNTRMSAEEAFNHPFLN